MKSTVERVKGKNLCRGMIATIVIALVSLIAISCGSSSNDTAVSSATVSTGGDIDQNVIRYDVGDAQGKRAIMPQ